MTRKNISKELAGYSTKPKQKIQGGRVVLVYPDDEPDEGDAFEAIEQELEQVKFDNMDKDDILLEIQKVDRELLRINARMNQLNKTRRHVFKGDADALNLQLRTLKQRSDMLFKCLDKVLPDKRESKIDLNLKTTEADQIPDDVLAKIVAGTLTEEEYEHYAHLLDKDFKQKQKTTRH